MRRSLFWLLDRYPEAGESIASVYDSAIEQAVEADRLGFESLWLAEHHFLTIGSVPNPAILLAAIAQRTERIRLGPAAAVLPLRDPIHVAEDYALVDVLSGGRLNLGVGSGSKSVEFAPFGVEFDRRRELCAASLEVIRERWSVASSGVVGPNSLNIAPVQSPAPPIFVATMSEKSAYSIGFAGEGLLTLVPPTGEGLSGPVRCVGEHSRGLRELPRRDARAESIVMMLAHVAETEAEVRSTVVPALARLLFAMDGCRPSDPEGLYDRMRSNDAGLFGTPDEVGLQLGRIADHGVEHVAFLSRFGGMSRGSVLRSLSFLSMVDVGN